MGRLKKSERFLRVVRVRNKRGTEKQRERERENLEGGCLKRERVGGGGVEKMEIGNC